MPSSPAFLAGAIVVQLVLIVALIWQWRRGRRSLLGLVQQRKATEERTGELVHELNQPLTAILSNAQAAQRFLALEQPDVRELREIIEDIVTENKRAAGIARSIGVILKETESSEAR